MFLIFLLLISLIAISIAIENEKESLSVKQIELVPIRVCDNY